MSRLIRSTMFDIQTFNLTYKHINIQSDILLQITKRQKCRLKFGTERVRGKLVRKLIILKIPYLDLVKRKSAFEHAQNVQINMIIHMRKVSSTHLSSIEILLSIR